MMLNSIVVGFLPDYLSRHRFVQLSHVFCVSLSVTIFNKHWCTCVWVCIPGYYGKLHHDWSRCNIYIRCPIYSCYTFNGHIRKLDRFSDQQKFNTPTKTQPSALASIRAAQGSEWTSIIISLHGYLSYSCFMCLTAVWLVKYGNFLEHIMQVVKNFYKMKDFKP